LTDTEKAHVDRAHAADVQCRQKSQKGRRHSHLVSPKALKELGPFFAAEGFPLEPMGDGARPLHGFSWKELNVAGIIVCVPVIHQSEATPILEWIRSRTGGIVGGANNASAAVKAMLKDTHKLDALLANSKEYIYSDAKITHVALIVVVEAEVSPILEDLDFQVDEQMSKDLLGLATVRTGMYKSYKLSVLKVADSKVFHRHYSGYTQAAAVAALTAKVIRPSLVISFGTAGGIEGRTQVGDVVLGTGCLFLDRLRTRSKGAFDWGLWGGGCVPAPNLAKKHPCLKAGVVASQIGYTVSSDNECIIKETGIACLDMEAASEAQILGQAQVNFLALKCISNGVYPGEPHLMEKEYHDNREEVSKNATRVLRLVFDFLDGKAVSEL